MILDKIKKANDIKAVPSEEYGALADEIRQCIIENVGKNGGHLSSSLGVVELTMALHLAFDLPSDKIIWDVGHQSYAHKILTGRREVFSTLRREHGISGFPSRFESECDCFGTGHASTSVSAALGFVRARELSGGSNAVAAVIGDGAMTGGMVYEALNNAGAIKSNLIIILNDNEMSISKNVGGISKVLNNLRTDEKYANLKYTVKNRLSRIPGGDDIVGRIHKTKSSIKQLFVPGMVFEDMGITYLGPIDGHDVGKLVKMINMARRVNHAVIIHVHTQKGRGYYFAEKRPSFYHGVEPFEPETGKLLSGSKVRTYSDVFSAAITKNAASDSKIVAITAAMSEGCGLKKFEKFYPERFFDVGIAEEHAVTFAAGMAAEGYKPYVAVYSTFLQRAFDQIIHDVCIQRLPVRFIVERAGITGCDGVTHQGIFDISYMNIIPEMTVLAPKNRFELKDMIDWSVNFDAPLAIRFPKGRAGEAFASFRAPVEYGKSELLLEGKEAAILAVGSSVEPAEEICRILNKKGIFPTLVNARFVKPIDTELIDALAAKHKLIVTVEENIRLGGYGLSVLDYINSKEYDVKVHNVALADRFIEHGDARELREENGLAPKDAAEWIADRI
ncbi:MAG: 1-deoxy-D-xylulose-5-phosphate synthase [Butyrivibrio sp.]|nr:1-deoxy-D-xylulose-5-phosphate synthase [Butyrivibrio sp.]